VKNFSFILCFFLIIGMTACSAKHAVIVRETEASAASATEETKTTAAHTVVARRADEVAPGYEVELTSAQDEKLNGKFRIDFDGSLKLPYDIVVQTKGLSSKQLKDRVLAAYSKFYQSTPSMDVVVSERMYWVDVRGLVEKPGKYLAKADASVDELLAQAGGILRTNQGETPARYIRVQQLGQTTQLINLSDYYSGIRFDDVRWQGGDVIFVQRDRGEGAAPGDQQNYVKLLGQVTTPGEIPYEPGADFYHYLIKAGGPNEKAALYKIELVRADNGRTVSEFFSVEDDDVLPAIHGGDIVIVHADNTTGFEKRTRIFSEIASVVTSAATIIILAATL
jgi:protein involved in polysaccharide export with SLBB domain